MSGRPTAKQVKSARVRSPGAAGRSIIGRPAVTAFLARAAAIAMLVPAAAAAAVPAAATEAATTTDPGGGVVSPGSDATPSAPVPDAGPSAAPAQGDGSQPADPTPSPPEPSATGTPEPAGATASEPPQGATDDPPVPPADTAAQASGSQPSSSEPQASAAVPGHASTTSVAVAGAQNTSVVYQAIWQVQKGCQAYCYGTSQVQSASQSSTTHQSATATGGGSTPSGAVAVNVAGTVQFIFQTQLGCIAFCFTTSQVQSTSQSAQTTQSATATGDGVLTALNVAETFQFVWQVQQGCEVECSDASSTQSQTQQQASQSAGTPYRPFDGPQTFLAWIAVIAANNAATFQSVFQYDEALCLEHCTGDAQLQDAVLTAATTQQATAAVGDHEATKEPPGVPSPASAGGSADATRLAPAATTASPLPSASAAAPRASGAERPAVGAPATAMIAVVGSSPTTGLSQPAAGAHARAARAAETTNTRRTARRSLLAGATASNSSRASSHARRMQPARSLPARRPVALNRVQSGSRGPGSAWLVAATGLLVVLVGGRIARRRARRICTGLARMTPMDRDLLNTGGSKNLNRLH
jgi:hypothetical protein